MSSFEKLGKCENLEVLEKLAMLDTLKEKLDAYRPLPPEIVANLRENLILHWTYTSNAMEGNTLTLKETKIVLEGITVGGKTLGEHFEAINHREAICFVEGLVQEKAFLTEGVIRGIHGLILKNIDDLHAGVYRKTNVFIVGAEHRPPEAWRVEGEMHDFIHWCQHQGEALHPVERAARVHADFVKIHPFVDGNGRTSRLLMNFELVKSGFPPAILHVEKRLEYYETLDRAHTKGDCVPFLLLIAKMVEEGFEPYWYALGVRP
jgi:Fic family protein